MRAGVAANRREKEDYGYGYGVGRGGGGGVGRTNKSISDNLNQQKSERQSAAHSSCGPQVGGFMKFANSGDFNPWEEIRERVPLIAGGWREIHTNH